MSTFILALYLLLVGITGLVETKIPGWLIAVSALGAALSLAAERLKK